MKNGYNMLHQGGGFTPSALGRYTVADNAADGIGDINNYQSLGYSNPGTRGYRNEGIENLAGGSGGTSPIRSGLGALGMAMPAIGLLGEGIGAIQDYQANKKAEARMEQEIDRQRSNRDFVNQKFQTELDHDAARRQAMLRGQVANTPYYQQQVGRLANQYGNTSRMNADNQQKLGMGDKSGLSAQLAGQNLSTINNAAVSGTAQALGGQNRVYGALGPYAMSQAPEKASFGLGGSQYNESADYGAGFGNLFSLGNTAAKGYIQNQYNQGISDDINKGFGTGKYGGN
jgi:hypothetical protein